MPARPRANRTPSGAKRRWTPEDRAARTARRVEQFDAPADDAARGSKGRVDWYPGGRTGRPADERRRAATGRDERGTEEGRRDGRRLPGARPGEDRSSRRVDQGRAHADDRGHRDTRSARSERDVRPDRDARGTRPDRDARPTRDARGDRDVRPDRDSRGTRWDRDARPARDARGDRDVRPDRDSRGTRWDRDARPARDAGSDRDARGAGQDRDSRSDRSTRWDRDARPARDPRPDRDTRDARGGGADRDARFDRTASRDRGTRPARDGRPAREGGRFAEPGTRRPRSDAPQRSVRDSRPAPAADRASWGRRPDRDRFDDPRATPRFGGRGREDRAPRRPSQQDVRTAHWEAPQDVVLERLDAEVVTAEQVSGVGFAELGLGPQITRALAELGATEPFPIQAATIPVSLDGRNVLGRGRTGSGKTIAFGAALVERLMRNWADSGRSGTGRRTGRPPRALILAPTRELALQIDRTVQPLARAVGLFTTQIVGGVPQGRQVGALGKGVDIVIGTPGRMEDLLEQGRLDLSQIEITVLDEADHMADLGFLEPIQRLLRRVPQRGQRLLFSATLDAAVAALVEEFLPDPAVHEVAEVEGTGTADHRVLVIDQGQKMPVLAALLASSERSLVFARTRAFAEQLADDLDDEGVKAESLHGDLNQARRTRNLGRFSEGRVSALVATDVAARGIHVDDIELVVHADSAEDYKTYLHRSGRTGRAGASGTVVTLITARRRRSFTELLERAGIAAEFVVLHEGDDPVAAIGR